MKRVILILAVLLTGSCYLIGQQTGYTNFFKVPDKYSQFNRALPAYTLVLQVDSSIFYMLTNRVTDTMNMVDVVDSSYYSAIVRADSAYMNRIVVSDTLQGVVLYNSAGVKYRIRVSPTGVLTAVAVP